ncbi:hypothetical protein SME41J_36640 [Serratia marcescens]|nr:hypothetical protein SME41J_36640 [Serratia marcescens]
MLFPNVVKQCFPVNHNIIFSNKNGQHSARWILQQRFTVIVIYPLKGAIIFIVYDGFIYYKFHISIHLTYLSDFNSAI